MANVNVLFKSGLGQLNAELMRNGTIIDSGTTAGSGTLHFPGAMPGDTISIDGACAGTATLTIDVNTTPATPVNYPAGNIFGGFDL